MRHEELKNIAEPFPPNSREIRKLETHDRRFISKCWQFNCVASHYRMGHLIHKYILHIAEIKISESMNWLPFRMCATNTIYKISPMNRLHHHQHQQQLLGRRPTIEVNYLFAFSLLAAHSFRLFAHVVYMPIIPLVIELNKNQIISYMTTRHDAWPTRPDTKFIKTFNFIVLHKVCL